MSRKIFNKGDRVNTVFHGKGEVINYKEKNGNLAYKIKLDRGDAHWIPKEEVFDVNKILVEKASSSHISSYKVIDKTNT
ncbi:MAG: hypothetical protein ACOCQR_03470 [bacterium]